VNKKQWTTLLPLLATVRQACDSIAETLDGIGAIRDEEQQKLDNMPESLANSDRGTKQSTIVQGLDAICDFDLSTLTDAIDEVEGEQ
jgi:hypothetical protein